MKQSPWNTFLIVVIILGVLGLFGVGIQDANRGAAKGDIAEVMFTITLANGTVHDTTNETLASANGVKNFVHGSLPFLVGQSEKYPLDKVVLGMKPGQRKKQVIEPTPAPSTSIISREKTIDRLQSMPVNTKYTPVQFTTLFSQTSSGDYKVPEVPWTFTLLNKSETEVWLAANVAAGEVYVVPGFSWNATITDITGGIITFRHDPPLDVSVPTTLGPAVLKSETTKKLTFTLNPVPGSLVKTEKGMTVIANVTAAEIYMRPARSFLEETPFTIEVELVSLKRGVLPKK